MSTARRLQLPCLSGLSTAIIRISSVFGFAAGNSPKQQQRPTFAWGCRTSDTRLRSSSISLVVKEAISRHCRHRAVDADEGGFTDIGRAAGPMRMA